MPNLAAAIRKALDEHDREADNERLEERLRGLEESRGRDFTKDELKRILGELDDDDRDEIMAALVGAERWAAARETPPPATEEPPADEEPPVDEPPAERRTRPGRRHGLVYDWDVDEDGNVVAIDGPARIYQGEDEDEEVELPPTPETDDELEEEAAA